MTTGRGMNPKCTLHIALTCQILFDLQMFPFYFSPFSLSISDGSTVCVMASVSVLLSVSELLMGEVDSSTLLSLLPTEKSRVSGGSFGFLGVHVAGGVGSQSGCLWAARPASWQ